MRRLLLSIVYGDQFKRGGGKVSGGKVSDVVDALHRSWKRDNDRVHATNSLLLASDGSLLSCIEFTDYEIDFVYELYIKQTYKFDSAYHVSVAYHAVIINATGLYLAIDLHREQGDQEVLLFRQYGENDRLEYIGASLAMVYSWVSKVLHNLRREAEGR